MPPAVRRQRQVNLSEFGPAWSTELSFKADSKATEKPCLRKQTNKQARKEKVIVSFEFGPRPAGKLLSVVRESLPARDDHSDRVYSQLSEFSLASWDCA